MCQTGAPRADVEALFAGTLAQLAPVLAGLQALLEEGDTEVSDWLTELHGLVSATAFAAALPPLQQAIDDYAFDDALTQVQTLLEAVRGS